MKYVNNTLFQMTITSFLVAMLGSLEIVKHHSPTSAQPVQVMLIGSAQADVQATVYGADYCLACRPYKRSILAEMPKDGWIICEASDKEEATAHIVFDYRPASIEKYKIKSLPCTVIRKNGQEVKRIDGAISPTDLAKEINEVGK